MLDGAKRRLTVPNDVTDQAEDAGDHDEHQCPDFIELLIDCFKTLVDSVETLIDLVLKRFKALVDLLLRRLKTLIQASRCRR